jgi:hypothetical protein
MLRGRKVAKQAIPLYNDTNTVDSLARAASICEVSHILGQGGPGSGGGTALTQPRDDVIELRHLSKRFGEFVAVHDADFAIARGEFFAMLGPSEKQITTCGCRKRGRVGPSMLAGGEV